MRNVSIEFIGFGIMGELMCENVLKKGYLVCFYDINPKKIEKLAKIGGIPCRNLKEIANNCNFIIIMVPTSNDVSEVIEELLQQLKPNTIIIDMSTISPGVSIELAEKIKQAGNNILDAPVVKSKSAAISGDLGIYMVDDPEVFEEIKPIYKMSMPFQ